MLVPLRILRLLRYQPTYEELKPFFIFSPPLYIYCYQPTYEELKQAGADQLCTGRMLPAYL